MQDLLSIASGLEPVFAVLLAVGAALLLARIMRESAAKIFKRVPRIREVSALSRNPLRLVLSLIGVRIGLAATAAGTDWFAPVSYVLTLGLIASLAWLAVVVLLIIEVMLLSRYTTDSKDNRRMRRLKTQVMLGRRVGVAVIVTIAVACVLLTIPEVRALGAGILASAGLISIVAGLAVQSTLTNVFAGMQLAFTDAIRVDDVVVVETQWGTIEEITMTYVVVHLWDDRRLILPSTYFTTTPFENWTRKQSDILGTVELDLDWRAPVGDLRSHLKEVLAGTELWDGRTGVLQITDAVNSLVRVRILVSAADSGALFDLRCLVREAMVTYLQEWHPGALPRQRWEEVHAKSPEVHSSPRSGTGGSPEDTSTSQFFTGSMTAVDRRHSFAGPGKQVFDEREEKSAED
ncbi:mechanosensitive ion channel [Arthrobacter sp. zg-Y820]|uniref:mechanosensitive ion channel family protein n=1 Tax=unclassified Arthrobacter TaxID=235627 RepID=UPI001E284A60|nr:MULTISPECIES: mechanosensitive ion channel domain-containing protein [unclassified Arthrobacter]MCC9197064.1 mechanosensitive ion channel family protein [Arthrobacter sp. zg-Y820]MDK1279929.1 mechanosensitive ion channel [Arthrobacter sp. zg.Y820]WIB09228.1 mechanosensitive ion channel [Arthrobacter sp. zg-Y820]